MSVQHSDFMDSAESLLKADNPTEMCYRNAGSRAYYALYHRAAEVLRASAIRLVKVDNAGSHEGLIATIANQGPKGRSLAESLARFKRFRNNCDYDLGLDISEKRIAMQLAEARRLGDLLGRLAPVKASCEEKSDSPA